MRLSGGALGPSASFRAFYELRQRERRHGDFVRAYAVIVSNQRARAKCREVCGQSVPPEALLPPADEQLLAVGGGVSESDGPET